MTDIGLKKTYLVDTNVLRYYVSKNKGQEENRRAARVFWRQVLVEVEKGTAEIIISAESIRELDIQAYKQKASERERITKLLAHVQSVDNASTIEIEHLIRRLGVYIRREYVQTIRKARGTMNDITYGSVSDARILFDALEHEAIIVTGNIKDFAVYPFLFETGEYRDKLYDVLTNQYVSLSEEVHEMIRQDPTCQKMKERIDSLRGDE